MRRSILLAIVAALALALGLSPVAVASQDGATVSAKANKKGKKKGCKAKGKGKGKKKGKARSSVRKKGKGKGKSRGCKGAGANWVQNGEYTDARNEIRVKILGRGKQVTVVIPSGISRCAPVPIEIQAEKTTVTASKLIAEWRTLDPQRGIHQGYRLTLLPSYGYKLVLDAGFAFPDQEPCLEPGLVFTGRLSG